MEKHRPDFLQKSGCNIITEAQWVSATLHRDYIFTLDCCHLFLRFVALSNLATSDCSRWMWFGTCEWISTLRHEYKWTNLFIPDNMFRRAIPEKVHQSHCGQDESGCCSEIICRESLLIYHSSCGHILLRNVKGCQWLLQAWIFRLW